MNIKKILFKVHRFSAWGLLFLIIIQLISGYTLTNKIIPYHISYRIHTQIVPIPLLIFFILHTFYPLINLLIRLINLLKKKIKPQ